MRAWILSALLFGVAVGCTEPLPGDVRNASGDAASPSDAALDARVVPDGGEDPMDAALDAATDSGGGETPVTALDVAAGYDHTCVVTTSEAVVCWGANDHGQLGRAGGMRGPGVVAGLSATRVCAGDGFSCALATDQTMTCWGDNAAGQLGRGTVGSGLNPEPVTIGLTGVRSIACGTRHACAWTGDAIHCWGSNSHGQLGIGNDGEDGWPRVATSTTASSLRLAAGLRHTCASESHRTTTQTRCWGDNASMQILPSAATSYDEPQLVNDDFVVMGLGRRHSCFSDERTGVQCFGGDPPQTSPPSGLSAAVEVMGASLDATCAQASSEVICWGTNADWQLGASTSGATQEIVSLGSAATVLSGGASHFCAIAADRRVWCWGANASGQARPFMMADSVLPAPLGM